MTEARELSLDPTGNRALCGKNWCFYTLWTDPGHPVEAQRARSSTTADISTGVGTLFELGPAAWRVVVTLHFLT